MIGPIESLSLLGPELGQYVKWLESRKVSGLYDDSRRSIDSFGVASELHARLERSAAR